MSARDEPLSSRVMFKSVLFFLALWLVSLVAVLALYAKVRETGSLALLGTRYEGNDAWLLVLIVAVLPVMLLAVAMRKLIDYRQRKQR